MAEFIYQMYQARKAHGDKVILDDVTLSFYPGAKIGVVGPNGMGKSTLLKIMAGIEEVSNGDARLTPGYTVGILQQEPPLDDDKTVIENVRMAFGDMIAKVDRFNKIGEEMCDPDCDMDALMAEMGKLQDEIDAADGWDIDSKLGQAMDALQLPDSDMPVNVLSGGERRRVALCKLLLEAPDLLLLDEPTNHLDAESILWLEHFLHNYQGAVLAVTHDRYFLDNVAEWICEVDRGHLYPYKGNYSTYLETKAARIEAQGNRDAKLAKRMEAELEWVRSSPKARQAKNKARLARYEEMEAEARASQKLDWTDIRIPVGPRLGNKVLEAHHLHKEFDGRVLIDDLSFTLPRNGIVGVIGPNGVGKSTLFNVLAGDNISIVKDTPGVTRDRIYADVEWLNHKFTLVDTGGIEPESKDIILSQMRDQAQIAIDTANVIIFITDVRQGLVDADAKVADMLRRSRKPVVLVVNKVDNFDRQMMDVYEFYNLGIGEPHAISASGKLGIGDMLDEVTGYFEPEMENEEESEIPRIAIVGKPNVGKSSLVNKLLGSNRVIVSDIAGTTRDAIDTTIMHNGNEYIFIDTAGLRKKNKIKEELERYSIIRTVSAVERADVVVLLIDATEGVTEQDAKIAGIAHERGKGMIIAVNKWDALEKDDKTIYRFTEKVRNTLAYMPYAELLFISAKTGQRLPKLFETIDMVLQYQNLRVQTGVLNEILTEAMAMQQPPSDRGKRLKIYYMTQVSVKPPTFVIFVNDKELMHFSYVRYLENKIRESFGFRGTPLKFIIRERKEKEQ